MRSRVLPVDCPSEAIARSNAVTGTDMEDGSADDVSSRLIPLATQPKKDAGQLPTTTPSSEEYKDKTWAVAFTVNVLMALVSAAWFGSTAIEAITSGSLSMAGRRRLQLGEIPEDSGKCFAFLLLGACSDSFGLYDFFRSKNDTTCLPDTESALINRQQGVQSKCNKYWNPLCKDL